MNESQDLERRYRRLLSLYPKAFRLAREQEVLTVLMDGARPDQRWPRPGEVTNLAGHGVSRRARQVAHPDGGQQRPRPPQWVRITRTLVGIWLVILTTIFCATGHWWGLSLLTFAALHFWLAYHNIAFTDMWGGPGGSSPPPSGPGD